MRTPATTRTYTTAEVARVLGHGAKVQRVARYVGIDNFPRGGVHSRDWTYPELVKIRVASDLAARSSRGDAGRTWQRATRAAHVVAERVNQGRLPLHVVIIGLDLIQLFQSVEGACDTIVRHEVPATWMPLRPVYEAIAELDR